MAALNWNTSPEQIHAAALGIGVSRADRITALTMAGVGRADLEKAIADPDEEVAAAAASNPRAAQILGRALQHPSDKVRAAAAGNQSLGALEIDSVTRLCTQITHNESREVQVALARNISIPERFLTEMAQQSGHREVRDAATATLAGVLRSQSAVLEPAERLAVRGDVAMFGTPTEGFTFESGVYEAGKLEATGRLFSQGREETVSFELPPQLEEFIRLHDAGGPLDLSNEWHDLTDKEIELAFSAASMEVTEQSPFVAPSPAAAMVEGPRLPLVDAAASLALAPWLGIEEAVGVAQSAYQSGKQENAAAMREAEALDAARRKQLQALLANLYEAAGNGDESVLYHAACAQPVENMYGKTPVHRLCEKGCVEAVRHPLAHLLQDQMGNTPLHYAAAAGLRASFLHPEAASVRNNAGATPADIYREVISRRVEAAVFSEEEIEAEAAKDLTPQQVASAGPRIPPRLASYRDAVFTNMTSGVLSKEEVGMQVDIYRKALTRHLTEQGLSEEAVADEVKKDPVLQQYAMETQDLSPQEVSYVGEASLENSEGPSMNVG